MPHRESISGVHLRLANDGAVVDLPAAALTEATACAGPDEVHRTPVKAYILVACVAAATLGLELIQTRILSFLYYNHVVYLTVTIALLGFGISGVFVSLFASRCKDSQKAISLLATAFLFTSFACLSIVSRIPQYLQGWLTIYKLVFSYVALVTPFLFSGAILGWMFTIHAKCINRLYFADLACSSGAVIAFVLLLWPLGGDWFVWLCSSLIAVGFFAYSRSVLNRSLRVGVLVAFGGCVLLLTGHLLGKQPELYKTLGKMYWPGWKTGKIEVTQWTPISRIDLWSDTQRDLVFGTKAADPTDSKMITQDADAFTMLWGPKRANSVLAAAHRGDIVGALSLTYILRRNPEDSLVIGVGGGIDMVQAKAYGAKRVIGVEINPATVSLMKGPYRDYVLWPRLDGVSLLRREGRNYVRSKPASFDTIVMSGVDTFSALNSGAYVLSENYLYTVDAVEDYLNALKPNGVMAIYRWFFYRQPRESLRLAHIFLSAAERMKLAHPDQSIMVISEDLGWRSYRWAATFIKREPFRQEEVRAVLAAIAGKPTLSVAYLPKVFSPEEQSQLEAQLAKSDADAAIARTAYNRLLTSHAGPERDQFVSNYPFRIDPVYDDRPFFFEYFKEHSVLLTVQTFILGLRSIRGPATYHVLYVTLLVCALICLGCILCPLFIFRRRGLNAPGTIPLLLFFSCLGFGYMMFEVGAMQLLNVYIGDPAYSLSLVLGGLLVATGLGAALSGRSADRPAVKVVTFATLAAAAMISLWIGFSRLVHPSTMQLPLAGRAIIVLLALFPVGLLLGIPFPTAVREAERRCPDFIAWAWGVNGVTSVLASIVAIVVAMKVGFTVVVALAALTYVIGFLTFWWHSRSAAP